MSELDQIRTFVQIINSGSVKRAAEELGVDPSVISRRLKELEIRLGTSLIQRTTRRMKLTGIGRTYFLRCIDILEALEVADEEVRETEQEIRGRMKIAVPISFGVSRLAPVIYEFMSLHPQLQVDMNVSDSRVDLVGGGYDLVVRIGDLEDSTLVARKISHVDHLVCASPSFLRDRGPFRSPADLKTAPALCYTNLAKPNEWQFRDKRGHHSKVIVRPRLMASNGDVLREAAVAGLGIVCEPEFVLEDAIRAGSLIPILKNWEWHGMDIHAVYPKTTRVPRRTRALIDFLVSKFVA